LHSSAARFNTPSGSRIAGAPESDIRVDFIVDIKVGNNDRAAAADNVRRRPDGARRRASPSYNFPPGGP
jgi:hypothetical protein